jgi:hypothetical protein
MPLRSPLGAMTAHADGDAFGRQRLTDLVGTDARYVERGRHADCHTSAISNLKT